jgi:hypothetical protein
MKTFVTLLAILLAMAFVMPAFAGEEPYKAAVWNDWAIPDFHMSAKLKQFTHYERDTAYYDGCTDVLFAPDPRITSDCETFGNAFLCPSACSEQFKAKTPQSQPEVCCSAPAGVVGLTESDPQLLRCPDYNDHGKTALTSAGNSGWYEWVIALPKKPEGEINIEIECGALKPNSWPFLHYDSINVCAAVTGEPVGPNCTRLGANLITAALPTLEVTAHPGCSNDFEPFHLTAYRTPSNYAIPNKALLPGNTKALQALDGNPGASIALKACMEETVLAKMPEDGIQKVVKGQLETEANLEAGDLIKVRMMVPKYNTVDLYCGKWSVTLGGIGEPDTLLDAEDCPCISDYDCKW